MHNAFGALDADSQAPQSLDIQLGEFFRQVFELPKVYFQTCVFLVLFLILF